MEGSVSFTFPVPKVSLSSFIRILVKLDFFVQKISDNIYLRISLQTPQDLDDAENFYTNLNQHKNVEVYFGQLLKNVLTPSIFTSAFSNRTGFIHTGFLGKLI